jgi:hypothetical protein
MGAVMNDWVIDLILEFIREHEIAFPQMSSAEIITHLEVLVADLREGFTAERDYEYRPESPLIGEVKTLKAQLTKREEELTKQHESEMEQVLANWRSDYNRLASDYRDLQRVLENR